ncbi:hypothetical protein FRB97_008533 [Tulasnella sp. 331]|nr:hypothetical protein FRB97_008533 [Tulasnella sp. 331]
MGAASNLYLTEKIGFGKSAQTRLYRQGAAVQVAMYAIMSPAPPFPVLCVTYVVNGLVIAVQVRAART